MSNETLIVVAFFIGAGVVGFSLHPLLGLGLLALLLAFIMLWGMMKGALYGARLLMARTRTSLHLILHRRR